MFNLNFLMITYIKLVRIGAMFLLFLTLKHGCLRFLQKPTVQAFILPTLSPVDVVDTGLKQNRCLHIW